MIGTSWRKQWFFNIRADLLSGLVVALALIPEAIAFSLIAGVDPQVGLYASVAILFVTALVGGRPGMISAATAAMALLMITLVKDYGLQYLFAATILTGFVQIGLGILRVDRLLRFVPRAVMIGFVNALAILIVLAQMPEFAGASWVMYAMVVGSLVIIYGLPRLTKAVPSPLVAIVVMTIITVVFKLQVRTVGDLGQLPSTVPSFALPTVPFSLETFWIVLPYAFPMAIVGLLESFLTATLLDDVTDTPSNKQQEAVGQGLANIVAGCFGGMAGCAMIGQSIINVKSGGRGRLSTFIAGFWLLLLMLVAADWLREIPMGVLVAVMFMVGIGTFDWAALKQVRVLPRSETIVMIATVVAVVHTHDLSIGVGIGILLSAVFFARRVAKTFSVTTALDATGLVMTIHVHGQLFFVSTETFLNTIPWHETVNHMIIDLSHAHLWDSAAVGAIDKVVRKGRRQGKIMEVIGLNHASATIVDGLGLYHKEDSPDQEFAH